MAVTIGIVGVAGAVGSGIMNANAAGKAANAAQGPLHDALGFQEGVYNTAQTNLSPYITGGQEALGGVEQFLGLPSSGGATGQGQAGGSGAMASYNQFTQTPFYTFPLAQNVASMDRAAAAKGFSLSGGEMAGIGQMAGNYSASNFGSYLTALQNLAGVGQTASGTLGQIGGTAGQQVGNTENQIAAVNSQGIMGRQAGINQAINGLTGGGGAFGGGSGSGSLANALGGVNWGSIFGGNQMASGYAPPGSAYNGLSLSPTLGSNWTGRDNQVPYGSA